MRYSFAATLVAISLSLTACSHDTSVGKFRVGKPYSIAGKTYYPQENYTSVQTGIASWYGPGFHGNKTANGERFDQEALTAAHPTLQMPSLVKVTNLENGRSLIVRVNDRGPFHSNRIMDLSKGAARELGVIATGTARVRLEVLGPESMALAAAAKQGVDTRGAEVAMNDTGQLDARFASFFPNYVAQPQPDMMIAASGYQPGLPAGAQVQTADTLAVPVQADPIAALIEPQQTIVVDTPQQVAANIPVNAPVQQLPERHKAAIFQMAPIAEANAGEYAPTQAVALAAEAPQPNYLPQHPKFLGMRPIVDGK